MISETYINQQLQLHSAQLKELYDMLNQLKIDQAIYHNNHKQINEKITTLYKKVDGININIKHLDETSKLYLQERQRKKSLFEYLKMNSRWLIPILCLMPRGICILKTSDIQYITILSE